MSVAPQGAAVLRMLSDFLSEPVFVQGLSVCLFLWLLAGLHNVYIYFCVHLTETQGKSGSDIMLIDCVFLSRATLITLPTVTQ